MAVLTKTLSCFACGLALSFANMTSALPENLPVTNATQVAALVKAQQMAVLSSQIDGVIDNINVKVGDSFKQGDVLLSIDCTLQTASLQQTEANLKFVRNEYKSIKALQKLNSTTKIQMARSESEVAKAEAEIQIAIYRHGQCELKAPFDGSVVQSWVMPYETVSAKTQLLKIVNNNDLSVEFLVPSDQLTTLQSGKAFRLMISETGQEYNLEISKVVPLVDSVNRTVKAISYLQGHDEGLWAGMSGWVVLE